MVTAEFALALPAVVVVTALCVWAVMAAAVHIRCLDAARSGARELARGEPAGRVSQVAADRAPAGAQVRLLHLGGDLVAVQVRARVPLPVGWDLGPSVTVGGRVVASTEDSGWPP